MLKEDVMRHLEGGTAEGEAVSSLSSVIVTPLPHGPDPVEPLPTVRCNCTTVLYNCTTVLCNCTTGLYNCTTVLCNCTTVLCNYTAVLCNCTRVLSLSVHVEAVVPEFSESFPLYSVGVLLLFDRQFMW